MHGHLEPQTSLLRIYREKDKYPSPYTWSCEVVLVQPPTVVELRGVMRAPSLPEARAIRDTLKQAGYAMAIWRRADGRVRQWMLTCDE